MQPVDDDTGELIQRASRGDAAASQRLLDRHRARLRRMVAVHMDRRLLARIDPSDVVQEALTDACQELSGYLQAPPLPFYPWLRQIAWERLVALHHRHISAQKRSVRREERLELALPDESVVQLAGRLIASGTSPSRQVVRAELRDRVRAALTQLSRRDRELLVMRHLEQMTISEIASVLEATEGAVKTRLTRALVRLRGLLVADLGEGGSWASP